MSNDTPVFIEFDENGRPFSVFVDQGGKSCAIYDVEYSKSYGGLLAHMSGGGFYVPAVSPGGTFWAREGIEVEAAPGSIRLSEPPKEYQGELWDWADAGYTVYCSICDDQLPTDDTSEPCEHVRWCDECEDWSTPDEPCEHDAAVKERE